MPRWNVHFDVALDVSDPRIVQYVARAHAFASVIKGIPIPPHVQDRLDRLNIVRAVRGTTGIEGTELTEEEVSQILETPDDQRVLPPSRSREAQEVRNADELMTYVAVLSEKHPHEPLSEDLIRKFHEVLTQDINYEHNEPGRYRTYPVRADTYHPPDSGEEVQQLMAEFIE